MASGLNEDSVEKKLRTVNNTQDSIQTLSLWIIHHKSQHVKIVELWMKVLKKTVQPAHRLTLFYLCNDVVQNCKKKKAFVYNATFKEQLAEAASLVRDHSVKGKVERIFNIWRERNVYDATFIKNLISILNGQSAKKIHIKPEADSNNGPISPANTPFSEFEPKEAITESHTESMGERDADESARILAEFKPHEMIDQITAFRRQETDIKFRISQLSHLKLDASSIEAIKQLKDRAHGNDFSTQFEDSCTKLEDLVKRQTQLLNDQMTLLEVLNTSETFYEEQYREAKIVANAYKNFGARINNMKKKLDELKKTFPVPDSPIPSPDIYAPSPGSTPPHLNNPSFHYNPVSTMMNYDSSVSKKAWSYNGSGDMGGLVSLNPANSDTFQDSPPLEAPSPEGSPPDLNLDGSQSAGISLDSRLASFFDRNKNNANPPVYTPQIARPSFTGNKYSKVGEDDGSATPLDDEAPTTPVLDEHLSPPKPLTPPKKEKPIDFLSRLISQTQKTPLKPGPASFLDSISLLTSKKASDNRHDLNTSSWKTWQGKSNESNLLSPSFNLSTATSPMSFPPTPTTVSTPMPLPVPPPSIPLGLSLSMPPPPPPPFSITTVLHPDYSTPPPGFQQTSPGQKENWPDIGHSSLADHALRSSHSSVLKELVSADSKSAKESSSLVDSDAMDLVSEDEKSLGGATEAKSEFAQKLKQKTMAQGSVKSHVFVPNPERPNLVTLAVQDDLDEEDMIDDNTILEDNSEWSKTHKSSHKSKSRSRSKEKDRTHKHKKKKKHKRSHSDEDVHQLDDDNKSHSSLGSVVKKIDSVSRSSNRNSRDSFKGEKYEDDRKYERVDDRQYGNCMSYKNVRGSRDPVEAYTQAYRDAFFQQYTQSQFNSFPSGSGPVDHRARYKKYPY